MLASSQPAPPALVRCPSYHLLPQPLRVDWEEASGRFGVHSGLEKQRLHDLELKQLQCIRMEMQLVGGSNLDLRGVPSYKRADLVNLVDYWIRYRSEEVDQEPTSPPRHMTWPWKVMAAAFKGKATRAISEVELRFAGTYVLEREGVPKWKHEEVHRQVFNWLEAVKGEQEVCYRLSQRAKLTLDEGGWWLCA